MQITRGVVRIIGPHLFYDGEASFDLMLEKPKNLMGMLFSDGVGSLTVMDYPSLD